MVTVMTFGVSKRQLSTASNWCKRDQVVMTTDVVTNGVIIGGGRIGSFLHESNDKNDLLFTSRDQTIPSGGSGPIYVCTRNNDLDAIIDKTPVDRRADLVFLQNGILTDFLRSRGLEDNTQALIYFAVSKKGEKPIDGKTDLNPEGLTAVTGKWGKDLALRLQAGGLSCHVYDKATWEIAMASSDSITCSASSQPTMSIIVQLEKHIWICAFMAIGSKYKCTVGEVEKVHNAEVRALIGELAAAAAKVRR